MFGNSAMEPSASSLHKDASNQGSGRSAGYIYDRTFIRFREARESAIVWALSFIDASGYIIYDIITIYVYRGMLMWLARSIMAVIPTVINVYLARFARL
jgi:hypothetical protein